MDPGGAIRPGPTIFALFRRFLRFAMRFLRQFKSLLGMLQRLARLFVRRCVILFAMMGRGRFVRMGRFAVEFDGELSGYVHWATSSIVSRIRLGLVVIGLAP
jgi:hypothetical protein